MVLGALAPTPLRLARVEASLAAGLKADQVGALVDAELNRIGHPLPRNAWKLDAAVGLVQNAYERLTAAERSLHR